MSTNRLILQHNEISLLTSTLFYQDTIERKLNYKRHVNWILIKCQAIIRNGLSTNRLILKHNEISLLTLIRVVSYIWPAQLTITRKLWFMIGLTHRWLVAQICLFTFLLSLILFTFTVYNLIFIFWKLGSRPCKRLDKTI